MANEDYLGKLNHGAAVMDEEMDRLREQAPFVCPVCGVPRTAEYSPCDHENVAVRKCE